MKLWNNLVQSQQEIKSSPQLVFCGGACSTLGSSKRHTGRDELNDWLDQQDTPFFETQIHPDTHGVSYDYDIHGPGEQAARDAADVLIYEITPYSYAFVTLMEAVRDVTRGKKVVIWFNGPEDAFDPKGNPIFVPPTTESPEAIKAANAGRKNLATWFKGLANVRYCRKLNEVQAAILEFLDQPIED